MASKQRVRRRARRPRSGHVWGPGAVAGLSGAFVMGLLAMIVAAASGEGFFAPMRLVAGTFLGLGALSAGFGAILLGIVTHLAVGLGYGVIFAAILGEETGPGMRFVAGLLYGMAIFIVMTLFIMPLVDMLMATRIDVLWFLVYHLVYGFTLALVVPAARARRTAGMRRPLHA